MFAAIALALGGARAVPAAPYALVDTAQTHCFSDTGQLRTAPRPGQPFYGQDAFYQGAQPSYRDNGDGTISDLNTGLTWQKTPSLNRKMSFADAVANTKTCRLAGHGDWRLPTLKELYSLIDFTGSVSLRRPYLSTKHFDFRYGDEAQGERLIDAQYWSCTEYVGLTMRGNETVFGVNFADGRIKGYPKVRPRGGGPMLQFVRYVRGNPAYGRNQFVENQDGTVSDLATGLLWAKADSGKPMNWEHALAYCENLTLAGHEDWRLPNAKELQSLVDYTRAPDARDAARRGPAIAPVFQVTDPEAWFWTSTTHLDGRVLGERAVYVAFGQATGFMQDPRTGAWQKLNVHGAGAQRSDPKTGDPKDPRWVHGHGPQGDEIRILNFARGVRNADPAAVRLVTPDTEALPMPPPGREPPRPHGPFGPPPPPKRLPPPNH
jgi:hypothetical protein